MRRLRELLAAAGRLAEFGRFAAQQIHELRQPLFAIHGLSQLLLEKERVDLDEVLDFARHIVEQSERLTALVSNLRGLSIPAGLNTKARAEIGTVLLRATGLLEFRLRKGGATLRTQIAPDLPPLAIAESALEQILINLLANALDAVAGARNRWFRFGRVWFPTALASLSWRSPTTVPELPRRCGRGCSKRSSRPRARSKAQDLGWP